MGIKSVNGNTHKILFPDNYFDYKIIKFYKGSGNF